MAKAKKKTMKEHMHDVIFHMLENGWSVNHEYVGNFKTNEVDFEALMLGMQNGRAHLIADVGEETFVATFQGKRLIVRRMKPTWKKLATFPIGQIQIVEGGIQYTLQTGITTENTKVVIPKTEE